MTDVHCGLPYASYWVEWADGFIRDHLARRQAVDPAMPGGSHLLTGDEQLTIDDAGPYRELTLTVIVAALRHQAARQQLDPGASALEASALHLRTPDRRGGVEGLLRFSPFAALEGLDSLAESDAAEVERVRLLLRAATGDPDGHLLWRRVSGAAYAVLEGVIRHQREATYTMQDQLVSWYRQSEMDRLGELFGED